MMQNFVPEHWAPESLARQERAYVRADKLQCAVVASFPVSDTPIRLVSSNGQECPVRFLHQQGGLFVDLPPMVKTIWQMHVHRWLVANPGAALVQNTTVVII